MNITCGQCVFANNGKCVLFDGDDLISPSAGTCGLWVKGIATLAHIGGITKVEAGYMENATGFQCKRCGYFDVKGRNCSKVDKDSAGDNSGTIHPDGCCNLWFPDPVRCKLNNKDLAKRL